MRSLTIPVDDFIKQLKTHHVSRVPGTAVFLSKTAEKTPPIIIWQLTYNKALHEHLVTLTVVIAQTPIVDQTHRFTIERLAPNFWRIIAHYGFMEKPNIPSVLFQAAKKGCHLDLSDVTYYVGHETILHCSDGTGLPLWQEKIFALLQRNSAQIHEFLNLPTGSVVEIGRQVEI